MIISKAPEIEYSEAPCWDVSACSQAGAVSVTPTDHLQDASSWKNPPATEKTSDAHITTLNLMHL